MGGGSYFYVGSLISNYFLESRNPAQGAAFTLLSSIILLIVAVIILQLLKVPNVEIKRGNHE